MVHDNQGRSHLVLGSNGGTQKNFSTQLYLAAGVTATQFAKDSRNLDFKNYFNNGLAKTFEPLPKITRIGIDKDRHNKKGVFVPKFNNVTLLTKAYALVQKRMQIESKHSTVSSLATLKALEEIMQEKELAFEFSISEFHLRRSHLPRKIFSRCLNLLSARARTTLELRSPEFAADLVVIQHVMSMIDNRNEMLDERIGMLDGTYDDAKVFENMASELQIFIEVKGSSQRYKAKIRCRLQKYPFNGDFTLVPFEIPSPWEIFESRLCDNNDVCNAKNNMVESRILFDSHIVTVNTNTGAGSNNTPCLDSDSESSDGSGGNSPCAVM